MYTLPKLAYGYDELEPYIDAQTMQVHHTKHHQAYIDKLNNALESSEFFDADIVEILKDLNKIPVEKRTAVRNNGGGHWNHSFFWQCMKPGGSDLNKKASDLIDSSFGSFEEFKNQFEEHAIGRFGSGWVWLVRSEGSLVITSTANQDNPIMDGSKPEDIILGLDVWEHAYYLKYQNRRPDYVQNWWNVVDWDFVSSKI